MNENKVIPTEFELEEGVPLEPATVQQWTEGQRRKAKSALYGIADSLDQSGVSVDEVCKFLALYGQQIGDPEVPFRKWEDRAYLWAEKRTQKKD